MGIIKEAMQVIIQEVMRVFIKEEISLKTKVKVGGSIQVITSRKTKWVRPIAPSPPNQGLNLYKRTSNESTIKNLEVQVG